VERLICPSSQGDLPAINPPQIEPQWIHLFQQKASAPNVCPYFSNINDNDHIEQRLKILRLVIWLCEFNLKINSLGATIIP
jgi:hypothetical protein